MDLRANPACCTQENNSNQTLLCLDTCIKEGLTLLLGMAVAPTPLSWQGSLVNNCTSPDREQVMGLRYHWGLITKPLGDAHQWPAIACQPWERTGQNDSPCPEGLTASHFSSRHKSHQKITWKRAQSPRLLEVVSSVRARSRSHPPHWTVSLRVQGEPEEGQVYQNWTLSSYTHLFINLHLFKKATPKPLPGSHLSRWLIFLLDTLLLMYFTFKIQR